MPRRLLCLAITVLVACRAPAPSPAPAAPRLTIETWAADSLNFHVVSAFIAGPTEAILVDAQNSPADGRLVAERIAASGRRLTAIFITHADHDHYTGAAAILARFPGTPVYMTAAAVREYDRDAPRRAALLARVRQAPPAVQAMAPDSFVTARPAPATLTIDGQAIEVLDDLQGDIAARSHGALWIPSLRTVVAGDVVFHGIHLWLAASTPDSRAAWLASLDRLRALRPATVVPGHTPGALPPGTEAVTYTRDYLSAFDEERGRAASAPALVAAMERRFPAAGVRSLLLASARAAFAPPPGSGH